MKTALMKNGSTIDFRRSLPPRVPGLHSDLSAALEALASSRDLAKLTWQSVPRGSAEDRLAGARFVLPRYGSVVDPSRIVVTNGTQNALLVLLKDLVGADGVLLAEQLSYGALRAVARWAGIRVQGVAIDESGIVPEAFEEACRKLRPRALYCNPTVQNPTTAVMPEDRRQALVDIARRHGVVIIEDDALGRLHADAPAPLATMAPEICWYVMSTTKCLGQGLRIAYLVAPSAAAADRLLAPIEHLSFWHPAPLLSAVVTHWVASNAADAITARIAEECLARERQAREILSGLQLRTVRGSMHVWIELPANLKSADLVAAAESRQILIRPAELFSVDDQPAPNAVRLSLSPPSDLAEVVRGLRTLRNLMTKDEEHAFAGA
jgi:DNA-binding transcriptional MocR family regulator